jgi:hypothetical protein
VRGYFIEDDEIIMFKCAPAAAARLISRVHAARATAARAGAGARAGADEWCGVCRWGDAVRHGQGLDVVAPKTGMSRLTLRLDGTHTPGPTIRSHSGVARLRRLTCATRCPRANNALACCCVRRLGLSVHRLRRVACLAMGRRFI